jgi:hypothetical protein
MNKEKIKQLKRPWKIGCTQNRSQTKQTKKQLQQPCRALVIIQLNIVNQNNNIKQKIASSKQTNNNTVT